MINRVFKIYGLAVALLVVMPAGIAGASTLDDVIERDQLRCGVSDGVPGFSVQDEKGNWSGIDVDLCRAVAAATLGDAAKVTYIPLSNEKRLPALQDGAIDLLARNTTWTLTRDTSMGVSFAGINFFDGQGFLVRSVLGIRSSLGMDGLKICVQRNTTSFKNLKNYFTLHAMKYTPVVFDNLKQMQQGFEEAKCDAISSDKSLLFILRKGLGEPSDGTVLPEIISREPMGPVVQSGDDAWFKIVRWSLYTMINAEEMNISSDTVERIRKVAQNADVRLMLGQEGETGKALGLAPDWSYQIIRQVGNYGESFERNLGKASGLGMKRGHNALWSDGGLLYAPPFL